MFNVTKKQVLCVSILNFFVPCAYAEGVTNISPELMNYGMIPLVFLVMYLLVIRPQNKKAKLHQQMLTALRRNDQVLTAGGIIGTVHKIENDQEVQVEIADGVRVRIAKATITQVLAKTEPLKTSTVAMAQGNAESLDIEKDVTIIASKNKKLPQSRKKIIKPK